MLCEWEAKRKDLCHSLISHQGELADAKRRQSVLIITIGDIESASKYPNAEAIRGYQRDLDSTKRLEKKLNIAIEDAKKRLKDLECPCYI